MTKKDHKDKTSPPAITHCQYNVPDDTLFLRLKNQPVVYGRFSSDKQKRKAMASVTKAMNNHLYDYPTCPLHVASDEYIVSFTTSPRRGKHIAKTVASILAQNPPPKAIVINLPIVFRRDGTYFEQIDVDPRVLASGRVRINWVRDMGPSTKCLGLLEPGSPLSPNSTGLLIYCDDDHEYKAGWAYALIQSYNEAQAVAGRNNAVTCLMGLRFDKQGHWKSSNSGFRPIPENRNLAQVMAPEGFMGVAMGLESLRELATLKQSILRQTIPKSVMLGDDLMIGNELARLRKRVYVPITPTKNVHLVDSFDYGMNQDALHQGADGSAADQAMSSPHMRYTKGWDALTELQYNFLHNNVLQEKDSVPTLQSLVPTTFFGILLMLFILYMIVLLLRR